MPQGVYLGIFHIPHNHLSFIELNGMSVLQSESWRKSRIRQSALKKLLNVAEDGHLGRCKLRSHYVSHTITEHVLYRQQNALRIYFEGLFNWAFHRLASDVGNLGGKTRLVLNLMPFSFPSSIADKIVRGLRKALENNKQFGKDTLNLVILTRNSSSFSSSIYYQDTVSSSKYKIRFVLVDYRGYSFENVSTLRRAIDQKFFRDVLSLNYDAFYRKLIYGTNSYIGHFLLSHSHVRTHYDLTDFVREDDIFEYISGKITEIISDYSNIVIVYTGLEQVALQRLANELCRRTDTITDVIAYQLLASKNLLASADCVLVLTDIINSGHTLAEVIDKIRNLWGGDEGIECYGIIKMSNTPPNIGGLVYQVAAKLLRPYHENDKTMCALCKMGQPSFPVSAVTDFAKVHEAQLTPFDFWEMVCDCNALRKDEADASGRVLAYRVETKKIIDRYGGWLKNVIVGRYRAVLSSRLPTRILTVDEGGGMAFARLVQQALTLEKNAVLRANRTQLTELMMPTLRAENPTLLNRQRVLLVDDGINEGNTMRMLANYCAKHGTDPMAVFVLDNRLDEKNLEKLKTAMSRIPVMSLYSWPGKVMCLADAS